MAERKTLNIELKADVPGMVRAVFSTFNQIDKDGDVTLPGAFSAGESVRLLPAHNWAHYAIGKGSITADDERAIFDGQFNLNTSEGKNWYESVKDIGELQEWSYGYDVLDAEPGMFAGREVRFLKRLKVHEVSPVTLGAGIGTETLAIKSATFSESFEHADGLVSGLEAFVERVRDRCDSRAKEGRSLSEANRQRISKNTESLRGICNDLDELARPAEPKQDLGIALQVLFEQTRDRLRRIGAA